MEIATTLRDPINQATPLGDRNNQANSLLWPGRVASAVRALGEARRHFERAAELHRQLGQRSGEREALLLLVQLDPPSDGG